jgi:BMFP domain-containing protein YqiC
MKLKRQVLTGLSVDYAGQGIPLFFKDVGEPFNVKLELAFQEISLITREDFNEYGSTAT